MKTAQKVTLTKNPDSLRGKQFFFAILEAITVEMHTGGVHGRVGEIESLGVAVYHSR